MIIENRFNTSQIFVPNSKFLDLNNSPFCQILYIENKKLNNKINS